MNGMNGMNTDMNGMNTGMTNTVGNGFGNGFGNGMNTGANTGQQGYMAWPEEDQFPPADQMGGPSY